VRRDTATGRGSTRALLVVAGLAGLATLALALSACDGAGSPAGPSGSGTSATSATGAVPFISSAPGASLPTTSPAAAASGARTIHLILRPVNDTIGSLKSCSTETSCQGDFMVGYDPLIDPTTGEVVGALAYECFLVDPGSTLYHCPGNTITLEGRGQVVFTELIQHAPGKPPSIAPITGGSGEFRGATGTVTAKVLADGGDFVITINN
jgi:hypothetical protein